MRLQGISALLAATALASGLTMSAAMAETVKLGVLDDMSGVYTDLAGPAPSTR